ncbi:MAG TPA: type I glyceraldehyde-3-phosphate dehydrogenase [Firmicutes bacterium]|nr:type I glyceraldehyde-3-phosphate dehydrogenase [Bacillota bacterium]
MTVKVGINGFGRIGRLIVRIWANALRRGEKLPWDIVAVNSRSNTKVKGHTLRYDTIYGRFDCEYDESTDEIHLPDIGKTIKCLVVNDPSELPWKEMGVDISVEATGKFTDRVGCQKQLDAGAKKVFISAPGKGDGPDLTVVYGINHKLYDPSKHAIISNASCTTNCLAPMAKVLNDNLGIEAGLMVTIHAYTHTQNLLDNSHKDLRRARAAACNLIPTTTGAAKAVGLVIPELKGKLTGFAIRVPTPTVSFVDLTCMVKKETDENEVKMLFKEAAEGPMKGIIYYETEPTVSSDHEGTRYSAIFDSEFCHVMGGKLVKCIGWYDNEWGYTEALNMMLTHMVEKGI